MVTIKRKTNITIETRQRTVIGQVSLKTKRLRCPSCGNEVESVTPERHTDILNTSKEKNNEKIIANSDFD